LKQYRQRKLTNVEIFKKIFVIKTGFSANNLYLKTYHLPVIGKQGAPLSQVSLQAKPSENLCMLGAIVVKSKS